MKSTSHVVARLGIFALLVAVQACSSSSAHPSATSLPVGTYTNPNTPEGPQTLAILPGAKYRQDFSRISLTIEGTTAITGDKVTLTETKGGDCTGNPGVYTVVVTPTALSFKKVQDTCAPRAADFLSGPWTSQH